MWTVPLKSWHVAAGNQTEALPAYFGWQSCLSDTVGVIKVTNWLNEDISHFTYLGGKERESDTWEKKRWRDGEKNEGTERLKINWNDGPSVHPNVHTSTSYTALMFPTMPIIFNSSLYQNPYGHNILEYYTCVHSAHDHSRQPFLPWGIVKCSLSP